MARAMYISRKVSGRFAAAKMLRSLAEDALSILLFSILSYASSTVSGSTSIIPKVNN